MRMLLVQPPQGSRFGLSRILTVEPLALECVGAGVRAAGHEAELVDLRVDGWDALDRALADRPSLLGVSCAFTTDVHPCLEVAGFVKERWPDLPLVVGGHHASLVPGDFLFPGSPVDLVAVGEGEGIAADLMQALRRGEPLESVTGVLGLGQREGTFRPRAFSHELDVLPPPDRSLTARYRPRYHHALVPRSVSVETSRGCPFDCSFCSVWVFYGRRAARRSPAAIVRELEGVDGDHVFFTDDIAFLNQDAYRELGERIAASGLKLRYACETRADLVVRYRHLFGLWSRVGLGTVFLGVEKVDEEGLASIRKRTRGGIDANVEAIQILRDEGITPMTTFITDPDWDEADFDRLEAFIEALSLPHCTFTILTPLPGTELYTRRRHELVTHDYAYYDILHAVLPTRLPLQRFYERVARLYRFGTADARPSWAMAKGALRLALSGDLWCMRRVYEAVRQMRDPAAYLAPPPRVRAPARPGHRERSWPWRASGTRPAAAH